MTEETTHDIVYALLRDQEGTLTSLYKGQSLSLTLQS